MIQKVNDITLIVVERHIQFAEVGQRWIVHLSRTEHRRQRHLLVVRTGRLAVRGDPTENRGCFLGPGDHIDRGPVQTIDRHEQTFLTRDGVGAYRAYIETSQRCGQWYVCAIH